MKKFLCFSLLMCCASLNACSEPELNSMLKHQNWEPLIPRIREAFKKKDTQTLGWIKKVGVSPYVPLICQLLSTKVESL